MKIRYYILLFALLQAPGVFPQMYILNEDFSGTSGTTPPPGWNINIITGTSGDLWHFDNPGERIINYPVTQPFAIFDSDSISADGQPETTALETPLFDASTSNYILLHFTHTFDPGTGGTGTIEAYDGTGWYVIDTYASATSNPSTEISDLSGVLGGIAGAKLRFRWDGNGSGFWAVDNIRIYASLPVDGGVVSIDSPGSPVVPGLQDVVITLGNFGYNTISSARIDWTADGIQQPPFNWQGSIGLGQTAGNIAIGSYDFQDPVLIKVWQSEPNGQADLNPYNDTVTKYLVSALCGTYTIGGTDPDFESFSQAAEVLNIAGISCPVTFIVRNGTYYEQFILREIQGISSENTVTFLSESGSNELAVVKIVPGALKYSTMIYLDGTQHVSFRNLGLHTGSAVSNANNALFLDGADHITLEGCRFKAMNQFDYGISISGSSQITIEGNTFESVSSKAGAITISQAPDAGITITGNQVYGATDWGYSTIKVTGSGGIVIDGNQVSDCSRAVQLIDCNYTTINDNLIYDANEGINVDDFCNMIEISGNRITNISSNASAQETTGGIYINNASHVSVFNNFIHTEGTGPTAGINLEESDSCRIIFNSINVTNTDALGRSSGILLTESDEIVARNNIFYVKYAGIPVFIDVLGDHFDFDFNDYFCIDKTIGFCNGQRYTDLTTWAGSLNMDENSLSVNPYYTSATDLSINQVLLNNAALPEPGIESDIDGVPRDPAHPDIGAKEYSLCTTDAGINALVSPDNPLPGGLQEVKVLLQNQGSGPLNEVQIQWEVNNEIQTAYHWNGNLNSGQNTEVTIGSYNFLEGTLYIIRSWTTGPNSATDCNPRNDTCTSRPLAMPLCGNYTIGGVQPDFQGLGDAVTLLNLSGITCPVTFSLRDGNYFESILLKMITGASAATTITFRSENGDSSKVLIKIDPDALKFGSIFHLEGSEHVIFRQLGFVTGAETGNANNALLLENTNNIKAEGCYFELKKESDQGINIQSGSQATVIRHCRIECVSPRAGGIVASGASVRDITIDGNSIRGATDWGFSTIRIGNFVRNIHITGNRIERCYRAVHLVDSDTAYIRSNIISDANEAITIDDWCSAVEISANRLQNIRSHENAPEGTNAISVDNTTGTVIFNNFIHTSGDGPVTGLNLQNAAQCQISFNSINIANSDNQAKSKGIMLKTSNGVIARNNIFNVEIAGTPVYITSSASQLDFDYNDYFSFDGTVGHYNGKTFDQLDIWADSLNMDHHSFTVKPFYTSDTDLSINQAVLNNAGVPVPGITGDIDGSPRDPAHPDIGAKEYNLCSNDAGINAVTNPVSLLTGGTEEVRVILQNQGSGILSSARINWQVNGETQSAFSWSGNLQSGANMEVRIGEYTFQNGRSYVIKAWTSQPNNSTDCNSKNDTTTSRELSGPLCGTYTIGGLNPDFESFGQAAEVLNRSGITCPVIFMVRDGIYYEKLILGLISGTSPENTVTFQSESGDSSTAVVRIDPAAIKYESIIYIDKSSHVRFKGLGFRTGSNANANNAFLFNGADDIELSGCYIEASKESDLCLSVQGASHNIRVSGNRIEATDFRAGILNVTGNQTQNIEITGNIIKGAQTWGSTLIRINTNTKNIRINGNDIERSFRTIYMVSADSITISGNTIRNSYEGIIVDNQCSAIDISQNRLINILSNQIFPDGTNGILVQGSNDINITNNFIQTGGDGPVIGINLVDIESCRIFFNSVNVTNTDPQGKSKGIFSSSGNNVSGRNNIFNVKNTGIPIHINGQVDGLNLDYNDYFHPAGIIGKVDELVISNLSVWGQMVNGDANSKVVNPYFKADTIPLPFQRILNGAGIPIPGILYDIDGKLRFSQAPDIGCTEFFVDYGILELMSPTLNCFHPSSEEVIAYIRQYGDVPFNDLKVAYQFDNGPVHIDTIPGPLIEDIVHDFGTMVNISAPGEYLFRIWLINTLDDNINNDTLVARRYSKPPPVVSMDYDNFCTGWEVHFTGQATVEEPYFIDHYEWLFGDGETSEEQNPVHTYLEPGTYDVALRAYSNAGCYSETITPVFIDPDFQGLGFDYALVNETCLGDSTGRLEIYATGGYPPYSYFLNGNPLDGSIIEPLHPGKYEIRVTDSQDCITADSLESIPKVLMNPQIFASPGSGYSPLTVMFDYTADSSASRIWHFPDNQTDTNKIVSYTFVDFGDHEVILEVNSGPPYFCHEIARVNIFVDIIITIEANSVFTPNGDGRNDFFEIISSGLKDMKVNIFNQWGNKIYVMEELDGRWDGKTTGGAEVPDGTYFWALQATGLNNLTYEREGSVLLLRHGTEAFPNPVSDKVKIKTTEPLEGEIHIMVYSILGRFVDSETVPGPDNMVIDLSGLSKGVYILQATDGIRNCYARIIKN